MVQCGMDISRARRLSPGSHRAAVVVLACLLALAAVPTGCESTAHSERIRITAESMNADGLFAKVEYLRDGKIANSVHLVDGDGDGVVDGKSGPKAGSSWPAGWQWFDDMYDDTVVGQTVVSFDGQKVVVTAARTYEFIAGEYEVRGSS